MEELEDACVWIEDWIDKTDIENSLVLYLGNLVESDILSETLVKLIVACPENK